MAKIFFVALTFSLALTARGVVQSARPASSCDSMTESTRARLTAYVTKLIKATPEKPPQLLSADAENDSCFRRLVFLSPEKTQFALFLSPDQRFLTPRLFDSNLDPAVAEAKSIEKTKTQIDAYVERTKRPVLGSRDAPVTIAVFLDFQCPFCRQAMSILETQVIPKTNGKARIAYINFPLATHPWAPEAAVSLSCVAKQSFGEFWRLHDYVFQHQPKLSAGKVDDVVLAQAKLSTAPALDIGKVTACVQSKETLGEIRADASFGSELGVTATPTLFINGNRMVGLVSADQITHMIDAVTTASNVHGH